MADAPSRKAFGDYQGQRVNPLPEGFLQSYANVAKNIQELGDGLGKGIGEAIYAYRTNQENDKQLNTKLDDHANIASSVITYLTTDASKNHGLALGALGTGSTDSAGPNAEGPMALAKAEIQSKRAKAISDYYAAPDTYNSKQKAEVLGYITASAADMNSAVDRADKVRAANDTSAASRAATALSLAKSAELAVTSSQRTTPNKEGVVQTLRSVVAQGTLSGQAFNKGQTPEQATAKLMELTAIRQKAIDDTNAARERGDGSVFWTANDEATFSVEAAGLEAYAKAVSPTEINTWYRDHAKPTVESKEQGAALLEQLKIKAKAINDNPEADPFAVQQANMDVESLESELKNYDGKGQLYVKDSYLADESQFLRNAQENRAFSKVIASYQAAASIKDKNGNKLAPDISAADVENLRHVVKLGGLGLMDGDGRRWEIDKEGVLGFKMDEQFMTILRKPEAERSKEDLAYINHAKSNNAKARAAMGLQVFGSVRNATVQSERGLSRVVVSGGGEKVIGVAGEPSMQVVLTGTVNDPIAAKKFRENAAHKSEFMNKAQAVILRLAEVEADGRTPKRDDNGELIPRATLSPEEKRAIALEFYQISKDYAKGTGRLTDKHYAIVSGMMGSPLPLDTATWSKELAGNAALAFTSFWRETSMTPAAMLGQMREVQRSNLDELVNQVKGGTDIFNVDEEGHRTGPMILSRGMWNHNVGGQVSDGKGGAKTVSEGEPFAKEAYKADRKAIKGEKLTPADQETIKVAHKAMTTELLRRIQGTGDSSDVNEVGVAWDAWMLHMANNKGVIETTDTPERREFFERCKEQGASEEALRFFCKYANNKPTGSSAEGDGKRPDGTAKGDGWHGRLTMTNGSGKVMTENSFGIKIDGKEQDIPSLVPTLDKKEVAWLVNGGNVIDKNDPIAARIRSKATQHAQKRIKEGKSPFKQNDE